MTNYKPTNFGYFLEKYPFNVNVSQDTYPLQIRPADPELTLDKAMTVLGLIEDQVDKILHPVPFVPTDFGFEEIIAEGDNEHMKTSVFINIENPNIELESHPTKAMTYIAVKTKRVVPEDEESMGPWSIVPEFSMELFIPNQIVGRIVLQSIGFLPLVNPQGYYENKVEMPSELSTEPVKEEVIDKTIPIKLWPFMKFDSAEDAKKFNDSLTGKNLFLSENPLGALSQIRSLRDAYKGYTFTGVEEAIQNHPTMTDQQKERALFSLEIIADEQLTPNEDEPAIPPAPVEPCAHCKGTGKSGVDLICLWCDGAGKEKHKKVCEECNGNGRDPIHPQTPCDICDGSGIEPENKEEE